MAWLALALVVLGLGYSFGIRSYLSWRATGDTGLRTDAGPSGSTGWWAKLLFLASIAGLMAGPTVGLAGMLALPWPTPQPLQAAGLVLAAGGGALVIAAQHQMGRSWRVGVDPGEATGLVTGGLFAYVRNPVFTGMTAFAAGITAMVPNAVSTTAFLVLLGAVELQVRAVEEPHLLRTHGDAYRAYAARTGRFLPMIGRLPSSHDTHHDHHAEGHRHDHEGHHHDGHAHGISGDADGRWLTIALAAIAAFMAIEVVAGILAQSLALISDAAHMLTDAAAIALALIAMRLAARPAKGAYTYGLKRTEILSAQINGISLLLLAAWLAYEAISRLSEPPQVTGWIVTATGAAGLAVNVLAAWAISKANRTSLNIQGAYQHVLMDALASLAAIAAGLTVTITGFQQADPIATLIVVILMARAGWRLLRESTRVLLDAAPTGVNPDEVAHRLLAAPQVTEVHDLHLWQITSGQPALSAHVLVEKSADCHTVRDDLQRVLADTYHITHTTLQVDHADEHDNPTGAKHCADPHGLAHRRTVCRA